MKKSEFEEKLMDKNMYVINCNGTERRYNPNLHINDEVKENSFGCLYINNRWYCYVTGIKGSIRCEKTFEREDEAYDYLLNYITEKVNEYKNGDECRAIDNLMEKLKCSEEQARFLYYRKATKD